MKDTTGITRGFNWYSQAWYYDKNDPPEIMFGDYDKGIEMAMRWYDLGGELSPRLEVFDESWTLLNSYTSLLQRLADVDGKSITEAEFVTMLLDEGFVDLTEREALDKEEPKENALLSVVKKLLQADYDYGGFSHIVGNDAIEEARAAVAAVDPDWEPSLKEPL